LARRLPVAASTTLIQTNGATGCERPEAIRRISSRPGCSRVRPRAVGWVATGEANSAAAEAVHPLDQRRHQSGSRGQYAASAAQQKPLPKAR
jgi:hypothetical protein